GLSRGCTRPWPAPRSSGRRSASLALHPLREHGVGLRVGEVRDDRLITAAILGGDYLRLLQKGDVSRQNRLHCPRCEVVAQGRAMSSMISTASVPGYVERKRRPSRLVFHYFTSAASAR